MSEKVSGGVLTRGPLLTETKRLLRHLGLRARKRLGQHFLIDEEVLELVISAADLIPEDVVIEVGSGLGVVTRELAPRVARLFAIELDDRLALFLKQKLASFGNVSVINRNILQVEPAALLREECGLSSRVNALFHYKVVANLPYYITSLVLRHFLEATPKPALMVVMVQKEVAEAIVAEPGRMSLLSVSVQYYGKPEIVGYVPARCFYPEPEVDSAILRITTFAEPAVAVDEAGFFRLVRAGFTASRKQLVNSLAQGLALPKEEVVPLLAGARIDSRRRAETLTLEEWAALWRIINRHEKGE
jgi:16S rRNA (adenine1518-N6/adenine1519-N6)-dimethyltransferase